jgi:CheY-like chemotaxis protein
MHQVLLNLCLNAKDAMPNGGDLRLVVENCALDEPYAATNLQAKPGRYVKFSVIDQGTGIPPEILDKIFEPFFTTKDINKGTGLGLSTVSAIVKSHGGLINVYSEPGAGTAFHVYLPAMETSRETRREPSEETNLPRGNGETILLVDDEAPILAVTSQILLAFGYRIITASDGAEALTLYAQHQQEIAVVLTDMRMPVLDGSAMIQALMPLNPAIKIIAASGLDMNDPMAKLAGTGVRHFLGKPYTPGTLLKILRAVLDEK